MGKGDRRGKAKPKGLPDLAPVQRRGKQPRERGRFTKPKEDEAKVALTARRNQYGQVAASEEERDVAKAQHMGSHIGWLMQFECPKEAPRLWRVWQAWCQSELNYLTRIIGTTGQPKGASIAAIPDKIETDTGHTVDLRTADERDRDAVRAYMRWRGYLGHLATADVTALHQARREDGPALWRYRRPTRHGLATLEALKRLADVAG